MTRPHEDLQRHTPTDHRPGGVPVSFASGAWCAIDVVHTKAERVDASISAYETLIEKARTSTVAARLAAVLRSVNDRRVIAIVEIEGHDAFHHLQSGWDDHHLVAQRHDVAESSTLGLYRVAASTGDAAIDPESKDAYAFEHVAVAPERTSALAAAAPKAHGFRGVVVFGADDDKGSIIVYHFGHAADLDAFRASAEALRILGPLRADGETISAVHPVRTFG
jgi:hypothetical protein